MASHAVYLDLAANIADLRSRVDLWQKGDEIEPERRQGEGRADRRADPARGLDWGADRARRARSTRALPAVNAALDAKDPAAAQTALKPHRRRLARPHPRVLRLDEPAGERRRRRPASRPRTSTSRPTSPTCAPGSETWEKGDEGEPEHRQGEARPGRGHPRATPLAEGDGGRDRQDRGPRSARSKQALDAKDAAAAQAALKPVADASHDVTHAYYGDWLPTAPDDGRSMDGSSRCRHGAT